MSYNKAIPQASDTLNASQPQILENFATVSALLGVDHVISPWTDPATGDQGKHNQVTLPEQGSDPTTAANEMAIYTKAVSGATQLFIANEGAGDIFDITSATKANTGETTLPSGIVIKWGRATTNASGLSTITFANAFATAIYMVQVSIAEVGGASTSATDYLIRAYNFDTTQLQVVTYNIAQTRAAASYNWFALGL